MNVIIFLACLALYLYIGFRFVRTPALAKMRTQIREKIEYLRVSLADVKTLAEACPGNKEIEDRLASAEAVYDKVKGYTPESLAQLNSEDAFHSIDALLNGALKKVNEARRLLPESPEDGEDK